VQRHDFDTRVFLFHKSARWLSKGNILNHVFVMKDDIKLFSELKANELLSNISDKIRLKSLAYLAKIFERFKAKRKG